MRKYGEVKRGRYRRHGEKENKFTKQHIEINMYKDKMKRELVIQDLENVSFYNRKCIRCKHCILQYFRKLGLVV